MASKRPERKHFVSLRSLRIASGKKQTEVCDFVTNYLDLPLGNRFTEGSLSLIENGKRGASQKYLTAIAAAYGLPADAISSDYEPQERRVRGAVA